MNEIQKEFIEIKAAYDAAVETENWDLVDELEDAYLDAEEKLVNFAINEASQYMTDEEIKTLRENWANPKFTEQLINLALRLA